MQKIRVGLAAYGLSGEVFHAPFITQHPGLELWAINQRHGKSAAERYPEVKITHSFEELLQEPIDLMVINTPDPTHYHYCRMALEARKNVVVEKPFVTTSKEARELIQLAQQKGVLLTVYQNRRFDGDFLTIQQILKEELLGRVVEFQSAFQRYRTSLSAIPWKEEPNSRVGITYNLCSHLADQAIVLFGQPRKVFAQITSQREGSQVDDYAHLQLLYDNHLQVSLRTGMLIREPAARFAVHGTAGSYVKFGFDPQEALLRSGAATSDEQWGQEAESEWGILYTDQGRRPYATVAGNYRYFYDNLYQALCAEGVPGVTHAEMLADIQILEAAFESAQSGQVVDVDRF